MSPETDARELLQVIWHLLPDLLQSSLKKYLQKKKFWVEILSNKTILTAFYKHHQETVLKS